VLLTDQSAEALERGLSSVKRALDRMVSKAGLASGDAAAALGRIHTFPALEARARARAPRSSALLLRAHAAAAAAAAVSALASGGSSTLATAAALR